MKNKKVAVINDLGSLVIRASDSRPKGLGWTFHQCDFVSKFLIATTSLHVPTTNQVVPSPPRTATPSGTINNYDMGWRLALRAICPATSSDRYNMPQPLYTAVSGHGSLGVMVKKLWPECRGFSNIPFMP
ncbi:hypothetical protein TNCV_1808531 [Trichonephila clavipes]|nr:hypothetical protein TNCV_1808531 [Trichonephila clavipes]